MNRKFVRGPSVGHRLALLCFFMINSVVVAQTFTVLDETTGTKFVDTLDGTTEFRYSVRLTGAGTLIGVVPELIPPACAQQAGQSIFNTTFMGIVGGSSTNLAVPTWPNNQTRELIFRVHMFNNSVVCDGAIPCGGGVFNFKLSFTHSSTPNPQMAVDPNDFLDIGGPPTDGFKVIDRVSETQPSACTVYIGNSRKILVTHSGFPASLLSDPDVRVFLGIDWNLNINNVPTPLDFTFGLKNFFYPTGPTINDVFTLKATTDLVPRANLLPLTTVILDESNVQFPLSALGGNGPQNGINDCTDQTWNFFDITNETPLSGGAPPMINHLTATSTNTITLSSSVTQLNFRKAGLFLVKPVSCNLGSAFGNPPTQIQFQKYNLLPDGIVEVTLSLPAAWTTAGGSQLSNSYTIEWFYRNNSTLIRATLPGGGATAIRNLSTNLAIPFVDPSDFIIEARIRRVGSNAVVSVQSPGHDLSYSQLTLQSFENGEFNPNTLLHDPDMYLDPGEILVQELRVQNQGSFANNIRVTAGRISPNSADFAFAGREKTALFAGGGNSQEIFQTNLSNNAVFDLDVLYELLQINEACGDIDLFIEVDYQNQGMNTTFRYEFSIPANCEFVVNSFSLDGNWIDAENRGIPPCDDSNCNGQSTNPVTPTAGWGFTNPGWVGSTMTRARFYTLTSHSAGSQGFPVGGNASIMLRHQATLAETRAGGIVEYQTANNGGPWSIWQDLILPIESLNGPLYSNTFFLVVSGIDNVLGLRKVFNGMTAEQNFDLPLPAGTLGGDRVRFRFLYHLVDDNTLSPGLWQISEFNYRAELPQYDDLFVLGNNLAFNACNPTIQLNPQPSGSYTFSWFTSFQDLIDDVPNSTSTDGIWNFPIPPNSTDYYVKVQLDNPGTVRVYKLSIDANTAVPPFATVLVAWSTPGLPGNTDIDSNGSVDVIDLILQIILDECSN